MDKAHLETLIAAARECCGKEATNADLASVLVDAAYQLTKDSLEKCCAPRREVATIREIVRNEYKLTDIDMISRRSRPGEARQLVMYLARKLTSQSLPQIGYALDRDHTSVMLGVKATQRRVERSPEFAAMVSRLSSVIIRHTSP